jgi:hypothetical protein
VIDDPARREAPIAYLREAHPVLMTTARLDDLTCPDGRVTEPLGVSEHLRGRLWRAAGRTRLPHLLAGRLPVYGYQHWRTLGRLAFSGQLYLVQQLIEPLPMVGMRGR